MTLETELYKERRRRKKDEQDRLIQIRALRERIRDLESIWELRHTYPSFDELLPLLREGHEETRPLKSQGDGIKSAEHPPPHESTISARRTVEQMNQELDRLVGKFSEWLGGRSAIEPEVKPICWNPNCVERSLPQPFQRAEENKGPGTCRSCGERFGSYRQDVKQCWKKDCPHRGRKGQCMHSIIGDA